MCNAFCWFCKPPPLILGSKYCFICGRRMVAVARYQMICLVLKPFPWLEEYLRLQPYFQNHIICKVW